MKKAVRQKSQGGCGAGRSSGGFGGFERMLGEFVWLADIEGCKVEGSGGFRLKGRV